MPRNPPTRTPSRRWWATLWNAFGSRPATGGSFLLVVALASLAAMAVTIWTFYSASKNQHSRGGPSGFRI
jgi:hypothetical protein